MLRDTQTALLLEALVLGPYMIYSAREIESPYFRRGMQIAGVAAILVAGAAWLRGFPENGFIGERANGRHDEIGTFTGPDVAELAIATKKINPRRRLVRY